MAEYTEEQFIALVKKSEHDANNNLDKYKFKLALFAVFGYVVIFTVLIVLVSLVGGSIAIAFVSGSLFLLLLKKKILFIILFAIWTFLKALWVKFSPPEGFNVTQADAPELFNEIKQLTNSLKALKIHRVLLTDELNAAVVQTPKFGLIGAPQNTLILGLQLLLALSPNEMRSVLAHEFGHLSGNHGKFNGWIYRIRITWERIMFTFDETNSFGAGLMRRFFDWYAPKFSAYSFALARKNEYEADQMAAALTSEEVAVKALANFHVKAPHIATQYWDVYFKSAEEFPSPPHRPYEGLAKFLKDTPIDKTAMLKAIKDQMQHKTHYADTNPSLKDRVNALTNKAYLPDSCTTNAAETWLGSFYLTALDHFDKEWISQNGQRWKDRYDYTQQSKKLIADYKNVPLDSIGDEKIWPLAVTTSEFVGDNEALPLYKKCYTINNKNSAAAFHVGRILANNKDIQALPYLRYAFEQFDIIEYAAKYGYDLLVALEKPEQAEKWWQDALQRNQKHQQILHEASNITTNDKVKIAELSTGDLNNITEQLKNNKKVKSAWIAQKTLPAGTEIKCYVIAIQFKGFYFSYDKALTKLAENFKSNLIIYFIPTQGDSSSLANKIKKLNQKIL